ncbi:MAG: acyl-CoA desaturase [Cyanobacteria bacterium P01_G01_bin.54]
MTATIQAQDNKIEWLKYSPYFLLHLGCLSVFWVGWSVPAILLAIALYLIRMFFVTGFGHRYFSHRAFKTSRGAQFIFAWLFCTAGQRSPLWWAAHHRDHHRYSDQQPEDIHSPHHHNLWISHMGWFMRRRYQSYPHQNVQDLRRYPELIWLENNELLPFFLLMPFCFFLGEGIQSLNPALGTSGLQCLVWGYLISTALLHHGTYTINHLAHLWGTQRFETGDYSRNNFLLALITLGEGWHNNHHWYPGSASQGLYWWEVDPTFYGLKLLETLNIIWDLRTYPDPQYRTKV